MNSNVKTLLEKAAIYVNNSSEGSSDIDKDIMLMNAFAELIVKECVKIVEGYCETSPEIYGLPLEILEHFNMEIENE
jgi:hypothetical protein